MKSKRCLKHPERKGCPKVTTVSAELHDSFDDIFKNIFETDGNNDDDYEYDDDYDYDDDDDNNTILPDPTQDPDSSSTASSVTTTVYNNLSIRNNRLLKDEANRMNLGPIGFELNGWIVLVACFGFSIILVTLVWKVTKRVCDTYETRALRPPPTIARISGENDDHAQRGRKKRKRARRSTPATEAMHRNMVMDVPIESLARMVRLQQQQLPGIETNRNMPHLIELTTVENINTGGPGAQPTRTGVAGVPAQTVVIAPAAHVPPPSVGYSTQVSAPPVLNVNPVSGQPIQPVAPLHVHDHHVRSERAESPPPNYSHTAAAQQAPVSTEQVNGGFYPEIPVPSPVAPESEHLPSSD